MCLTAFGQTAYPNVYILFCSAADSSHHLYYSSILWRIPASVFDCVWFLFVSFWLHFSNCILFCFNTLAYFAGVGVCRCSTALV